MGMAEHGSQEIGNPPPGQRGWSVHGRLAAVPPALQCRQARTPGLGGGVPGSWDVNHARGHRGQG